MAQRGVNKVTIIGNLGKDPDARYMPSGDCVTSISVATSEVWKDKQSGEQKERTEWHDIVMFRRLGEIAKEYLRKGSKVYVEGSLRTRKWTDKNGIERYTTEIVGSELQMLDSKGFGNGNQQSAAQQNPGQAEQPPMPDSIPSDADFDDDIPF